ncbi:hypothetical protein GXB85_16455 [Cellulomonas sp. APG4]|uniref:hypothetical protein n=1 Tax=Cellulomonas sp. APG4 TaxID=1538656 RepID=UPI00137ACE52|nr:hypothetical protein [Cellulomonas sp. APG4]NCT92529.1 hypothetical protein [Cellulomonas sp. APG4]
MLSSRHRKAASIALVAVALIGVRAASAAGVDLAGDQILVGEDAAAAACSSAQVQIDYDVAYVAALQGYGVSAARLSGLDERCQGYDVVVTLSGPGGAPLAEMTSVVAASEMDVVVPAETPVGADELTGVSVVLREAEV